MAYYMVSFDLEDPYSNDYDSIYARVKNKFPKSCKILSTTCLIKSHIDIDSIRDWFQMCTDDKNNISVFVVEWEYYSSWFTRSTKNEIIKIFGK